MDVRALIAQLPSSIPARTEERGTVIAPQTRDDVVAVLHLANMTRIRVELDHGQSVAEPDRILLDLSALNRVLSYREEEGIIRVESGMTVDMLEPILAAQHQRLPLVYSASRPLLSLLGEETWSISQTRSGPLRQWVMGVEAVTGDGESIHYGAEVVKNVTGYDMGKLFIGSRHRYGLITSVILKLEHQPESTRSFLFHVEELGEALELTRKIAQAVSQPEALTLFKTKNTFGWQILVTLSGYRERVQQEGETLHSLVQHLKPDLQELYLAPKAYDQWVRKLDWLHPEEPDALVVRIALPHKALLDLPYRLFTKPWLKSADTVLPYRTQQMLLRWISVNIPQAGELAELKQQVQQQGGFVEILRCPPALDLEVSRFNAPVHPVLRQWQSRLKVQFDPANILVDPFETHALEGSTL